MGQGSARPEPPALLAVRRHYDELVLLESVDSGAIAPLRGRWLVENLGRTGGRLQPRRDLPPEAFWSAAELRWLAQTLGDDFGDLFVAVSARWLSAEHADPEGHHLATIAGVAGLYLNASGGKNLGGPLAFPSSLTASFKAHGLRASATDFALFWDFASLHQPPFATDAERALFDEGRELSAVWFGHARTQVWLQTQVPKGFDGHPYEESGWCAMEAAVGVALKPPARCLDLGARPPKTAFEGAYGSPTTAPTSTFLMHACTRRRSPPPPTPERMAPALAPASEMAAAAAMEAAEAAAAAAAATTEAAAATTEAAAARLSLAPDATRAAGRPKRYALEADAAVVLSLYETFFECGLGEETTEGRFGGRAWDDADVAYFCREVLPRLSSLTFLDLSANAYGAAGAEALAAALCNTADGGGGTLVQQLTALDVSGNPRVGPRGVAALAGALHRNRTVTSVSLLADGADDAAVTALLTLRRERRTPPLLSLCGLAHAGECHADTGGDAAGTAAAGAAADEGQRRIIHLARMGLQPADARLLADEVGRRRAPLRELRLESNQIGPAGARALAEALRGNGARLALEVLDVSGNGIGADGAAALAGALCETTSLTSLRIESNRIGDRGAAALAEALQHAREGPSAPLASLDLSGNGIGAAGAGALAAALVRSARAEDPRPAAGGGAAGARGGDDAGRGAARGAPAPLKWLTWLDLRYNDLGEGGEAAVREALAALAERYEADIDPASRAVEL